MVLTRLLAGILFYFTLFTSLPAMAENSQDFGDYVVHFNALTTDTLPPKVTKEYGITRSKNRAMLNIAVLKKVMGTTGQPVASKVSASTTNLTGHNRDIELREVREGSAIYYIGEFNIANEESLDFAILVEPEGLKKTLRVQFQQQFFTQ